jgi:uncharacterized membrane protein
LKWLWKDDIVSDNWKRNQEVKNKAKIMKRKLTLSHFFEFSFSMMLSELVEIEDKGQLRINRVERSLKAVLKARKRWQLH